MANNVRHFAINADDVERARRFYETVFGWTFEDWGQPEFYRVHTGPPDDPGIWGALQKRLEPLEGRGIRGFMCTVSVDSLLETLARVESAGGTIVIPEREIPGVGRLIYLEDTEENLVCAMQYEPERIAEARGLR